MSDLDEVPDLTPEAKAFLRKHATTGEPSADEFDAARSRFLAPGRPLPAAVVPAQPRRTWSLRHEVLAAAAVLLVLVGAQGLYLAFRSAPAESSELKAVVEAYRAGDLEGAHRLASQSCGADACKPVASSLSRALGLANRFDALSPAELEQLAALDAQLSEGTETALGLRIAQRRKGEQGVAPTAASLALAEQLFNEGVELKRSQQYEEAALRLQKCVKVAPGYHPCYRMLGSVFAFIAARDGTAADMERARKYYQLFLEVAPPDDEYVAKVKAILDAAREYDATPSPKDQPALSLTAPKTQDAVPRETSPSEISSVQAAFKQGQSNAALAMAEQCAPTSPRCRSLATEIKEFESKSQHLESLGEGELFVVFQLDRLITGGVSSARGETIRAQLISKLFIKASQAKTTGNWVRAVEYASRILQLDHNHAGAVDLMREARDASREVYLRGYQLKESSPEEALRLFKEVMFMTPPDDDTHQKAKSRVHELEARLGMAEDTGVTDPPDLTVAINGTQDVTFQENIQRVALGDPNIADVSVAGPKTVRVKGVSRGKTTLMTWLMSGQRVARIIEVR